MSPNPRDEDTVFSELAALCTTPGFVHTLAALCYRDNFIGYYGELKNDDMRALHSHGTLTRTEIATLIGLFVQGTPSAVFLSAEVMKAQVMRVDELMAELHEAIVASSFRITDWAQMAKAGHDPFQNGEVFREPVLYTSDSAYSFQYYELVIPKYDQDDAWLIAHKGFSIRDAVAVAKASREHQEEKLEALANGDVGVSHDLLSAFVLEPSRIAKLANVALDVVDRVLEAFTMPASPTGIAFKKMDSLNLANSHPILRIDDRLVLFQGYSLAESLYESPFYWMNVDKKYASQAMKHRGAYLERFAFDRLVHVFGEKNVHQGVLILDPKGTTSLGEIDVMVNFGGRTIIVQAKSKRMTLPAKQGVDQAIKGDFQKAVQDAYDQAVSCAALMTQPGVVLKDSTGTILTVAAPVDIYIFCLVSDHYPALSFQARQFLRLDPASKGAVPFVLDLFTLDVIAEFLRRPLYFLSYVDRRAHYGERVMATHELVALAYHLQANLWVDDEYTMVHLEDSFTTPLDVAMAVRRQGVPGEATPKGILTRHMGTPYELLLLDIESNENAALIEFGLLLLQMGSKSVEDFNRAIRHISAQALADGEAHDFSMDFKKTGLTVHSSVEPDDQANRALETHVRLRKYASKGNLWTGICLNPKTLRLRFAYIFDEPWVRDPVMEEATRGMAKPDKSTVDLLRKLKLAKIGRNDPCHCGSGIKLKKCCLGKA